MPDIPDYTLKPTFPVASVIDAAQRNNQLQLEAEQAGQRSLVAGLGAIGQIGQSLYQRKLQMAQALAGAKMYAAANPELTSPTTTSTTTQAPVMRDQTANYDPTTGTATPNLWMSGVGSTVPQTTTTVAPPKLSLSDLQTAMLGERPMDVQKELFDRQKQAQEYGIKLRDIGLKERTEPQKIENEHQLQMLLARIQGQKAGTEATHVQNEDINTLLGRRGELAKDLPKGFWDSIGNEKAESAKQQIGQIDALLAAKGYKGPANAGSVSNGQFKTPNGVSYSVNP